MRNEDLKFMNPVGFSAYEKPGLKANLLFLAVLIFIAAMMVWIAASPLDEIVKGQGKIIPSSRIQSIQSVDGGAIEKISVREGNIVKAGQELVVIDDIRFNASVNELKNVLYSLKTKLKRLQVQSMITDVNDIPTLEYPEQLRQQAAEYVRSEKTYYDNKVSELRSLIGVSVSKYIQKQQEHDEIERNITKLKENLVFIEKQLKILGQGVRDGVMSRIDELKMKKEHSNTIGELEISELSLKRSRTAIRESHEYIQQQLDIFKSESSKELSAIKTEIKKVEAQLMYSKDKVNKSVIYSPVDGVVNHIYFTTLGGVVKPADVLMDIVPTDDSLLVEAKIDPKDIGFIGPDNKVTVKVTAYDFSIYGGLEGRIDQIGADSIFDPETRRSFYNVLIRTDKNQLGTKEYPLTIIPGMVTEINIKTGKKTILKYLLKPITKTIGNAMTER